MGSWGQSTGCERDLQAGGDEDVAGGVGSGRICMWRWLGSIFLLGENFSPLGCTCSIISTDAGVNIVRRRREREIGTPSKDHKNHTSPSPPLKP